MTDKKLLLTVGAAGLGVAALAVTLFRKNGESETVDDLAEVQVTAQLIDSPAPARIRWSDPGGRGEKYRYLFDAAETKYGIPSGLLYRQGYQECRFREDIITGIKSSSAGAVGMMQIIPIHHPEIDAGDAASDKRAALDPARAVDYAGRFLSKLKKQFGTWELALAAYNAGPGNVRKYDGIPPFKETQDYVSQITADVPVRNV